MQQINYQREMERIIKSFDGAKKTLLLHSCCGPCSSAVIERLLPYFDITVAYYNPNIEPYEEYVHRLNEQERLIRSAFPEVKFLPLSYDNKAFHSAVKGYEHLGEGSERCRKCFEFRLKEMCRLCKGKYDYFTTTLTVSPYKNAAVINEIGIGLDSLSYLPADFKKKEGYKRSIELSKQYNLYRQEYCGCFYSLKEAEDKLKKINT